jgi:hypothetical protein
MEEFPLGFQSEELAGGFLDDESVYCENLYAKVNGVFIKVKIEQTPDVVAIFVKGFHRFLSLPAPDRAGSGSLNLREYIRCGIRLRNHCISLT